MIEDQLRRSFARHEDLVPDAEDLLGPIQAGVRRRRRRRTAVASGLAVFAMLLAGAAPVLVPRLVLHANRVAGNQGAAAAHSSLTGPLNFLILGLDRRPGEPPSVPARTDTIIVAHVPADHRTAYLMSIPRDLLVDIPGYGKDKINAAYAYGGRALAVETVQDLTGLTFDGTAEIRFEGLSRLTDALGGVRMCLDQRIVSIHTGHVFRPGCQQLTGGQSLDLLRQRYQLPGGAIDRDHNARVFLGALLDQAARADFLADPVKLTRVIGAAGDAMTLNLPNIGLIDLAWELRGLRGDDLTGTEVPATAQVSHGSAVMALDPDAARLFAALRADDLSAWTARK
jgi:LCP family protein required for cell wall assembly